MIQFSRFDNGGFVLHKVRIPGNRSTYSAWFSPAGDLLDAERRRPDGRTSGVSPAAAHVRAELSAIGRRYAQA